MQNKIDRSEQLSPWSDPVDPDVIFPIEEYEPLLFDLGWSSPSSWIYHWLKRDGMRLAFGCWPKNVRSDWIWGLGLPFLSDVERYLETNNTPVLFGISGLPGCGKTSFGRWIEGAARELNWPITVVSMDDFYMPAGQLQRAMEGNPWNVSRGFP